MMKNGGFCLGCMLQWRQSSGSSAPSRVCLLKKVIGPIKAYVDNTGISDGLWRGESICINPKAGDADLWIEIWEELRILAALKRSYI